MPANPVRPLEETDVPAVADLHRRVFKIPSPLTAELLTRYRDYYRTIFFENPWRDRSLSPLVCEEKGAIVGFLGIVPRPMKFKGQPVVAALTSQFVVDPASRSMAGVRLLKACFEGPQDLTFADESTDLTRQLWERLGGRTAYCHSFRWLAPLRPAQLTISTSRLERLGGLLRLPAGLLDSVAVRIPRSPYGRPKPSALPGRPLAAEQLREILDLSRASLTISHTRESLEWVLSRISELTELHGPLHGVLVEASDGKPAGCYLYHRKPTGVSRVVLFRARAGQEREVIAHLFEDAWAAGSLAIGGVVPPNLQHVFARQRCMMDDYQKWFLVQSRSEDLLQAVCGGDDNFSLLDGEWITHFNYKRPPG